MEKVYLMPLDAKSYNYGGVLQQFALQEKCKQLGFDVKIINDTHSERRMLFSVKESLLNITPEWIISKVKKYFKKTEVVDPVIMDKIVARREKFNAFRIQYMDYTQEVSQRQLSEIISDGKAVIVGSDQIWNPILASYPLFLSFVNGEQKKIAYAASISRENLSSREKKMYAPLIRNFDAVSVREEKGKELISEYCSKNCEVVLDPTMLVDTALWENLADNNILDSPYVFCYFLGDDINIRKAAQRFAEERDMELVTSPFLKLENIEVDSDYQYKSYIDMSPVEFLKFIRYADYVITDSFHAVVFSILFKKKFIVVGRTMNKHTANSRLDTLLGRFNLFDRMCTAEAIDGVIDNEIDYKAVHKILEKSRCDSEKFLKDSIQEGARA